MRCVRITSTCKTALATLKYGVAKSYLLKSQPEGWLFYGYAANKCGTRYHHHFVVPAKAGTYTEHV